MLIHLPFSEVLYKLHRFNSRELMTRRSFSPRHNHRVVPLPSLRLRTHGSGSGKNNAAWLQDFVVLSLRLVCPSDYIGLACARRLRKHGLGRYFSMMIVNIYCGMSPIFNTALPLNPSHPLQLAAPLPQSSSTSSSCLNSSAIPSPTPMPIGTTVRPFRRQSCFASCLG